MIPITSTAEAIDTLPGEEIEFSIGDPRWVMRTQADLYSNRELAVAREYSTNARDAMIEAGKADQPIEVTLPSMMNPYFRVRDFGDGMSRNRMANIYTKFGTSTKRDSNEFNGVLGYGSKSALAYTETFTVTSVHEGIKRVAVIVRKPDWSIVMKIVSETPTTEASGTEIVVPVHNHEAFSHIARDFYKFWMQGTVLVDGAFPKQEVGDKITDGLYYSAHWSESYVVMGNVPYRIANPAALFHNARMRSINFVAYVDNGDVEFTPSREDLKYTQHTKDTLQNVILDFENQILDAARADIDSATTHFDAYAKWSEWTSRLGRDLFDELEFNGDKFMESFPINAMRYQPSSYYRGATYRISQWNVGEMERTLIVTDFNIDLNSNHKAKAREYLKLKGISASYILFSSISEVKNPWVDQSRLVSWEDLKAALPKKPRKARQVNPNIPGRIPGSWDYWTKDGFHGEKEIPDKSTVYWISVQANKDYNVRSILTLLDTKAVVLIVPANRKDKLLRENKSVKEFLPWAKSHVVKDGASLLSDEAKKSLKIGYDTRQWIQQLDVKAIDDPDWSAAASLIERGKSLVKSYDDNMALATQLKMWYDVSKHNIQASDDSLVHRYPLLQDIRLGWNSRPNKKHIYMYMNAVYAASKKGN